MRTPEGYLNARQAAAYVGYEPSATTSARDDKAMRAFYQFVRDHHVTTHHRGRRLLFLRADLDRAIGRCTDAVAASAMDDRLKAMEELGRRQALKDTLIS